MAGTPRARLQLFAASWLVLLCGSLAKPSADDLFKQLYSQDNAAAQAAYRALTEEEPAVIESVLSRQASDWRPEAPMPNYSLPTFPTSFLRSLSRLTAYCRAHGLPYRASETLSADVGRLNDRSLTAAERFRLERRLMHELRLADLTALEFEAALWSGSGAGLGTSAQRILDTCYAAHWQELTSDEAQLRLYLVKVGLFSDFGIVGACGHYAERFRGATEEQIASLSKLAGDEDPLVADTAIEVLRSVCGLDIGSVTVQTFLASPAEYADCLSRVKVSAPPDVSAICDFLLTATSVEAANLAIAVLAQNADVEAIPNLMRLLECKLVVRRGQCCVTLAGDDDDEREEAFDYEVRVCDHAVGLLEMVTGHAFPGPPSKWAGKRVVGGFFPGDAGLYNLAATSGKWRELWESDGTHYREWPQRFYAGRWRKLLTAEKVRVDDLNRLAWDDRFTPAQLAQAMACLPKVEPQSDLARVAFPTELPSSALPYFAKAPIAPEDIDDVVNDFARSDSDLLCAYIRDVHRRFTPVERGKMYYGLMWNTPFPSWLEQYRQDLVYRQEIADGLTAYGKDFDQSGSGYDNLVAFIAYVRWLDRPVGERLDKALISHEVETVNRLLASAEYGDLGAILEHWSELPLDYWTQKMYLEDDFGLPVDMEDPAALRQLRERYAKLDERALYCRYLEDAGVRYAKADGSLDHDAIYRLLTYDAAVQFAGSGSASSPYVCCLIRLLELANGNRLGFPSHFRSSRGCLIERTTAWREFLRQKGLVSPPDHEVPAVSAYPD